MKDTVKFNIVIAQYEDDTREIATAINSDELENLTLERLERILDLQRITLLEKGDERSKKEYHKITAQLVDYKDGEIIFKVAQETVTREEYVSLYNLYGDEELPKEVIKKFKWELV